MTGSWLEAAPTVFRSPRYSLLCGLHHTFLPPNVSLMPLNGVLFVGFSLGIRPGFSDFHNLLVDH